MPHLKTRTRTTLLLCIMALLTSLLLARVHLFGDAGLYTTPSQPSFSQQSSIPPQVRDTLATKCADCHSNQPHAPFYGRLAPFSWLMERDILLARKHFDLSTWDAYTPAHQQTLQAQILQQVRSGKMPLPQYRLIHWNAVIAPTDLQLLTTWVHQSSAKSESELDSNSNAALSKPSTAAQGKIVFEKRCTGSHSLD